MDDDDGEGNDSGEFKFISTSSSSISRGCQLPWTVLGYFEETSCCHGNQIHVSLLYLAIYFSQYEVVVLFMLCKCCIVFMSNMMYSSSKTFMGRCYEIGRTWTKISPCKCSNVLLWRDRLTILWKFKINSKSMLVELVTQGILKQSHDKLRVPQKLTWLRGKAIGSCPEESIGRGAQWGAPHPIVYFSWQHDWTQKWISL